MNKPSAIVILAGRDRIRFKEDRHGDCAPQLAVLLAVPNGGLEEFLAWPRMADMLIGDLPVLAVLEDENDAAQLARQLRLRNYPGVAKIDEVDENPERYPNKPEPRAGEMLPAPPFARALLEIEAMLDAFYRLSTDIRLGGFPGAMQAPADVLVDELAAVFRVLDAHPRGGKALSDLLVRMRRDLPGMFAKLGEAICAIVERAVADAD